MDNNTNQFLVVWHQNFCKLIIDYPNFDCYNFVTYCTNKHTTRPPCMTFLEWGQIVGALTR